MAGSGFNNDEDEKMLHDIIGEIGGGLLDGN